MPERLPIAVAALVYASWTVLTWWFEGRIGTFSRPDAVEDRIVYALVVNLGVGVVGSLVILRWITCGRSGIAAAGLGAGTPRAAAVAVGLLLGLAVFAGLGAPSFEPAVVLNAYAQVFVVSAAEILVCFALPAAALAPGRAKVGRVQRVGRIAVSAVLFGLYHFAHSPPFNEIAMVAFLTVVGLATGAFFALSGDAYATMLFHNFLGTLGVTRALAEAGELDGFRSLQWPLLATAALAFTAALALDILLLRRFGPPVPIPPSADPDTKA